MLDQLFRFLVVAGLAALAYLVTAIAVLESVSLWSEYELSVALRLAINGAAFLIAVGIAYAGLRRWTFASSQPHRRSLPRFVALAAACLAGNEILFYALVRFTPASYQLAFGAALLVVAALAFLASRLWVFAAR